MLTEKSPMGYPLGRENFNLMTKEWFKLVNDPTTGLKKVIKVVDEETKNHKTIDDEITTAHMPELRRSKKYPVQSYITYMEHLSPKSIVLWQIPKYQEFSEQHKRITCGNMVKWGTTGWMLLSQTYHMLVTYQEEHTLIIHSDMLL